MSGVDPRAAQLRSIAETGDEDTRAAALSDLAKEFPNYFSARFPELGKEMRIQMQRPTT